MDPRGIVHGWRFCPSNASGIVMLDLTQIPGTKKIIVFHEIITFVIVFHFSHRPRCAFSKEASLDLKFSSRSSENVRVIKRRQNTRTLLKNTMAARGTSKQLSSSFHSFVLHKPSINSHSDHVSPRPIFASTEMFMKFSSPNFCFQ